MLPPLPAALELACYRIVQEALINVVRHAHAPRAPVHLEVIDNGQGLFFLAFINVFARKERE